MKKGRTKKGIDRDLVNENSGITRPQNFHLRGRLVDRVSSVSCVRTTGLSVRVLGKEIGV